jgi:predicted acyltransferase
MMLESMKITASRGPCSRRARYTDGVQGGRLVSLDVFRGLTVAGMVLVNNPGTWRAVYAPLRHADWHGLTPTDLVFPFFLFIVGVAIPLALGRRLAEGERRGSIIRRIVRRAAIIFALGLALHAVANPDLATLRIPGVLQRIAVCYLVAAVLFVTTGWRTQAILAAVTLFGYWAALALVPVPGFGAGDLGKEGNLAAWLDRTLLGPHIWRVGRVYDPEGILSTVPAIVTTLTGVFTGRYLARVRPPAATVRGLLVAGAMGIAAGLLWDPWFPINKSLWSSSYVVFTTGAALVALAACYWLIEIRGWRWWTPPPVVLGVNALAVFFLSTLLAILLVRVRVPAGGGSPRPLQSVLFEALLAPWLPAAAASLAWALGSVLLWVLLMWPFFRRGVRLGV